MQDLMEYVLLGHESMETESALSKKEGGPDLTYNVLPEADSTSSPHIVSLGHAPAFEAIFYVRGDPERCRRLLCDAKYLRITINPEAALL